MVYRLPLMFIAAQLLRGSKARSRFRAGPRRAGRARQEGVDAERHRQGQHAGHENVIAFYFGANRKARKDAIAEANDRFRVIITSLMKASSELESTARALSDNAGNTTRLASVSLMPPRSSNNGRSRWRRRTEGTGKSGAQISAQVQESNASR